MQEVINLVKVIKKQIEKLSNEIKEMKKTHIQILSEEWMDGAQVQTTLGISSRTLQTLRNNGKLPFSQINRKIYFKTADVEALLEYHYNNK